MSRRSITFRIRHVARCAIGFGYFWAGGAVLGTVVLPIVARAEHDRWARARRCQRVVRSATRHFHRVANRLVGVTFELEAYEAAVPDQPCVVVANHPSLLDVTAFLAAHEDLCVVVKGDVFRRSAIGKLLRMCGHIDAGSGSHLDGAAVVQAARERLENGFSVLIFPEGTRSPLGGMHPFKRGAFELASLAEVPVLPVFVRCEPPALITGVPWYWQVPAEPFELRLTPLARMEWRDWVGRARVMRKDAQRRVLERVEAWHRERGSDRAGRSEAPRAA